ncbi:hypothetical protein ACTXT7_003244 [Hymenolepis weldensis]
MANSNMNIDENSRGQRKGKKVRELSVCTEQITKVIARQRRVNVDKLQECFGHMGGDVLGLHLPDVHGQTRYLVRFPQLTDSDFEYWKVYTDADFDEGYSTAEFMRSSRDAVGATVSRDTREANSEFINTRISGDARNPLSPNEKDAHPYSITYSADRFLLVPKINLLFDKGRNDDVLVAGFFTNVF